MSIKVYSNLFKPSLYFRSSFHSEVSQNPRTSFIWVTVKNRRGITCAMLNLRADLILAAYAPYLNRNYDENYCASNQCLLLNQSSPFQYADLCEDDYKGNKSGEDYEARGKFTSQRDGLVSHFDSESYTPARDMFKNTDNQIKRLLLARSRKARY